MNEGGFDILQVTGLWLLLMKKFSKKEVTKQNFRFLMCIIIGEKKKKLYTDFISFNLKTTYSLK